MKTAIDFLDHENGNFSNCGDPLDIEISSRVLDWKGILVERGTSPIFLSQKCCDT